MFNPDIFKAVFQVKHSGGSGSCFYLKSLNLFVTNNHVVEGFHEVAIHDHNKIAHLAKVVVVNTTVDLALLAVDDDFSDLPELTLAADDALTYGDKMKVAGYPYGMPFTVTEGTVSSPKQLMDGRYYVQIDAPVNPGNSGGPIFNEAGEVAAVTVAKFTDADNMGFGIRIEDLKQLLQSVDKVDRNKFQVQCDSCEDLIANEEKNQEFCPTCGQRLPDGVFDQHELSPLAIFCERAIERLGINPVVARNGEESWRFHKGSAEIRIFVYDNDYLFAVCQSNLLPKKNVLPVLEYMLSEDFGPFKMGIEDRDIYLLYRQHITDVTDMSDEVAKQVSDNLVQLALKADELDNILVERFGCEYSQYSRVINN